MSVYLVYYYLLLLQLVLFLVAALRSLLVHHIFSFWSFENRYDISELLLNLLLVKIHFLTTFIHVATEDGFNSRNCSMADLPVSLYYLHCS